MLWSSLLFLLIWEIWEICQICEIWDIWEIWFRSVSQSVSQWVTTISSWDACASKNYCSTTVLKYCSTALMYYYTTVPGLSPTLTVSVLLYQSTSVAGRRMIWTICYNTLLLYQGLVWPSLYVVPVYDFTTVPGWRVTLSLCFTTLLLYCCNSEEGDQYSTQFYFFVVLLHQGGGQAGLYSVQGDL